MTPTNHPPTNYGELLRLRMNDKWQRTLNSGERQVTNIGEKTVKD